MSADSILGLNWFLGLVFLLYFLHSSDDSLFGVNETKVSFGYRIRSVQPFGIIATLKEEELSWATH